jgi:uncharacterized membrane protein
MMAEAYGPVDFLVLEFPPATPGAATARALADLVDREVVGIYDLMIVQKTADGSTREVDLREVSEDIPTALTSFAGARSGLLGDTDVQEAAKALDPGTSALVILYENRWAVPFVAAARAEGVEVIASERLTAQELMDALDALEASV